MPHNSMLKENRLFKPTDEFRRQANISGLETYQALWEFADKDYLTYWSDLARELITWKKPFMHIFDDSEAPFYKWFSDGTLNVSYNCLDRHLPDKADKTALIFESDFGQVQLYTYAKLHNRVCRFANALRELGSKKGSGHYLFTHASGSRDCDASLCPYRCGSFSGIWWFFCQRTT